MAVMSTWAILQVDMGGVVEWTLALQGICTMEMIFFRKKIRKIAEIYTKITSFLS